MRALIIGCGAIGSHIAFCLYESGFKISILAKKETYRKIKNYGLNIQVNNNKKILIKKNLKVNDRFNIHKSLEDISGYKIDYIFVTVKLKDYNQRLINNIKKISNDGTAIIPPCTNIPFWWTNYFFPQNNINYLKKYFKVENIIGMTMWLSAIKNNSNSVLVRHNQRGYPLKALNKKMKYKELILRKAFINSGKSPIIKNIYSEIFSKSLNSLAFNMTAIYFQQNNKNLKLNKKAIIMLENIMKEGEQLTKFLKLNLSQSFNDRIKQTLSSSAHTMSMLSDYRAGKKVELKFLWDSFKFVLKNTHIKMPYTKKIYKNIIKKYKI